MASTLLVVADKTSTTSADQAIKSLLEQDANNTVTLASDEDAAPSAGTYDLIVIQESVIAGTVGTKYDTISDGVVVLEWALGDDMRFTSDTVSRTSADDQFAITDSGHALAGGLSGTVALSTGAGVMQYINDTLGSGLGQIGNPAELTSTDRWYLYCDTGGNMETGTAPARRVLMGLGNGDMINNKTSDFDTLLKAAFEWASEGVLDFTTIPKITGRTVNIDFSTRTITITSGV